MSRFHLCLAVWGLNLKLKVCLAISLNHSIFISSCRWECRRSVFRELGRRAPEEVASERHIEEEHKRRSRPVTTT
ncbi:hypothetical protein C8R45DRAFT_997010 [Mycena sanguinolenta]|nr:hypothetical protein C8R45DRAFT_997010 [Mycena sanguinolenta]